MEWWFIGLVAALLGFRSFWKTLTHPSNVLGRQAARMNWVANGAVKDAAGFRNMRVARDRYTAVISFQEGNVRLIDPPVEKPFDDFRELEEWISNQQSRGAEAHTPPSSDQAEYCERVEDYLRSVGHYEAVIELQGTDPNFCKESLLMYAAGYEAGQSEKLTGAFVAEGAHRYKSDPAYALAFMENLRKKFSQDTV